MSRILKLAELDVKGGLDRGRPSPTQVSANTEFRVVRSKVRRLRGRRTGSRVIVTTLLVLFTAANGVAATAAPTFEAVSKKLHRTVQAEIAAGAVDTEVIAHVAPTEKLAHFDPSHPEGRITQVAEVLEPLLRDLKDSPGVTRIRPFLLQPSIALTVTGWGLEEILHRPDIRFVEKDDRWPIHTAEGLTVIGADIIQRYGFNGDGTAIAVIDTGVDPFHPALGSGDIPNPKVVYGRDTADGDDDPFDCSGHGTAVASIAAGASFQWSPDRTFAGGVAPSASILAYKAAADSDCTALRESAVVAAIEDAVLHREGEKYLLTTINISSGGGSWPGPCDQDQPAMATAVHHATSAGIAVVTSSGNGGQTTGITSPACLEGTISVGSVWDQRATAFGSLFCLNETCSLICSDFEKAVTEPTCYSNTSPMLDLLAPSEYLRVAEAGGQITTFGGTSGAAPYVAGAIAVLNRAFADFHPAHLRIILASSGAMRTVASGTDSVPLIDVVQALDIKDLIFGDALELEVPLAGQPPLHSVAQVEDSGPVGGVQVWIRLQNPSSSGLIMTLTNPAGTGVRLWDEATQAQGNSLLFGCFGTDLEPAESLNQFIGSERHGRWELIIESASLEAPAPVLASWALQISPLEPPMSSPQPITTAIPIVARGPGLNDTQWRTGLRILNRSAFEPADIGLYFVPEGKDGTEDFVRRPVYLPAGHVAELDDIVGQTFDLEAAAGQLLIDGGGADMVVAGRIHTTDSAGGTFGQAVADQGSPGATTSLLFPLEEGPGFRTNIGLSERSGTEVSATITLFDSGSGEPLGDVIHLRLPPYSIRRVDRVLPTAGGPSNANFFAAVEADGAVTAWASVVDALTGDAILIPGIIPYQAQAFMLPVVARTPGRNETLWRSDVAITTSATEPLSLTLEFRPIEDGAAVPLTATTSLDPGSVVLLDDVLGATFGLEDAMGSLRIVPEPTEAAVAVFSRTYNQTDRGTYGQRIQAVGAGSKGDATLIHIDKNADFRTNVFLCETGGGRVFLEARLLDSQGLMLGQNQLIELPPLRLFPIIDVFKFFAVDPRSNCRLDLRWIDGDGSYTALASVVDQTTGDAISVPLSPTIPR